MTKQISICKKETKSVLCEVFFQPLAERKLFAITLQILGRWGLPDLNFQTNPDMTPENAAAELEKKPK